MSALSGRKPTQLKTHLRIKSARQITETGSSAHVTPIGGLSISSKRIKAIGDKKRDSPNQKNSNTDHKPPRSSKKALDSTDKISHQKKFGGSTSIVTSPDLRTTAKSSLLNPYKNQNSMAE